MQVTTYDSPQIKQTYFRQSYRISNIFIHKKKTYI